MNVEVSDAGKGEKNIKIHFDAADVKEAYDRYFKAYRNGAKVAGFRPGKAPAERIRKLYQKDIMEAVKEELRAKGFRQAIRDNLLDVVGENELSETGGTDENGAYDLELTVQVAPKFDLPDYKGLEVEAKAVTVDDAEVTAEIDQRRKEHGVLADADEGAPVSAGDLVQIDYEGTVDGKPVSETAPDAKELDRRENFWVVASSEFSFLPGFGEQLAGLKAGEGKTVEVDFGDAPKIAGLAGKKGSFAVTVKKIRTRKPAELDETFLKQLGVASEEELRKAVREELLYLKRRDEHRRREQALLEALEARTGELVFSDKQLRNHSLQEVYRNVRRLAAQRVDEETIRKLLPTLESQAQEQAPKELARKYVLRAVFDAEEGVVTQDRFQERMRSMLAYSGAKTLNELASRTDRDVESLRREIHDSFVNEGAVMALAARANWTGDEAEEASKAAKRTYRAMVARTASGDAEWDSWKDL